MRFTENSVTFSIWKSVKYDWNFSEILMLMRYRYRYFIKISYIGSQTWRFDRIHKNQFPHKINTFSDENVKI